MPKKRTVKKIIKPIEKREGKGEIFAEIY